MATPHPAAWPSDDSFGPFLPGHGDLTLVFENIVLAILPAALVLLLTPLCLRRAFRDRGSCSTAWTFYVEIVLVSGCFATELLATNIWGASSYVPRYASKASAFMCLAAVCMGAVLVLGRIRGHWPALPSVYAATTALFDLVRMRSYILRNMGVMAAVCLATTLIKALFVTFGRISYQLQSRSALLRSHSVLDWVIVTLTLGFKNTIDLQHLPELDPQSRSEVLLPQLQAHWAKRNPNSRRPLLKACFDTLRWELAKLLPCRLASFGFTFSQPFVIQYVSLLVKHGHLPPDVVGRVTVMSALVFLGIAISKGYYRQLCHRVSTLLRGILVSAIFETSLRLDCDVLSRNEAFKIMDTDLITIEEMPERFCNLCISFAEVSFGTYLLFSYVGLWCCLVLVPGAFVGFVAAKMAYSKAAAKQAWSDKTEHRVAVASSAMAQLPGINAIGLASVVASHIQELHDAEVQCSFYDRKLRVTTHIINVFAESITPMLVLIGSISWLAFPSAHSASEVFAIISLVYLVSCAMTTILLEVSRLDITIACFDSVEKFMLRESVKGLSMGFVNKRTATTEIGRIYSSWHFRTPELKKATLLRPTSSTPILQDVSIRFAPAGVSMVYGRAGCGKSSLMKVLLGEKRLDGGMVTMPPGPGAYCNETPWLVGNDIRANILAQHEYIEEWYRRVAWACLISEAEKWPDKRRVQEEDNDIDIGQRLRVQLARAAYGRPNLLILDDPCRGLDEESAMVVLDRLFGPGGVMRLLGITIIISTSNPAHLALADVAYELDGQGHVETLERPTRTLTTSVPKDGYRSHTRAMYEPGALRRDEIASKDAPNDHEHDIWLYWFLAESAGWKVTLLSLLLLSWTAFSERLSPVYIRIWLSTEPNMSSCFIGYAIVTVFPTILAVISISLFSLEFAPALSRSLHQDLVEFVFGAKTAYLSKTDIAKLINFFGQDMSLLSHDLPRSLLEMVHLVTLVMCDLFIIASCNIYIISIVAMFPATIFGMQHHYLGIYRRVQSLTQDAAAPLLAHFEHTAQGIIHIRAMRWESAFLERCHKLVDESLRPHYALHCMECWFHLVIDMFVAFLATICIGTSLCMADTMSETSIGLTMLTLVSFGPILCRLFDKWVKLQPSLAALHRLKVVVEAAKKMTTETTQKQDKRDYSDWKTITGRLDLYAVTAVYDGSSTDSHVVRNVSLQLPSAAKLAIIGPPGSGKSALLLSILTLLDYSGAIYIDGTNVQAIPPDVLRASIITLPQGGVELPGSIRRNMDPWATPQHSFSDAEIHAVLERVGLDELVQSCGGLSTDFASASLSRGEKQLLFLARAILRKEYLQARLVLVDDVTSGIDDETADRIQEIIETVFADCTVVMVTSRKGALVNMQRIIEMDEGRIVNMIDRPRYRKQESEDFVSEYLEF
ncbi:hypothetical protein ACQRIT_000088 [Beauveria bassiana]